MGPEITHLSATALRHASPAADPLERPAKSVERPLRAWSASDRERLAQAVLDTAARWRDSWGIDETAIGSGGVAHSEGVKIESPVDVPIGDLGARGWNWFPARAGLWWALALPEVPASQVSASRVAALADALFGGGFEASSSGERQATPRGSIAAELAEAAWSAWWDALESSLLQGKAAPRTCGETRIASGAWSAWSGSLLLAIPWPGGPLRVLAEGDLLELFLRPRPRSSDRRGKLATLWRAAGDRKARLRVGTEPFEVELETLANLRVGDVLKTTHRLEDPLAVAVPVGDGEPGQEICSAFLGRQGQLRAVELRRSSSPICPRAQSGQGANSGADRAIGARAPGTNRE